MMTADLALALLINRTSAFYDANPPVYMTYTEHTRVTAPTLGRAQSIDRSIAVRAADNFAVMQDLPNGEQRTGQAFPIVAYFDPFSNFTFGYFANLKRVDITIQRGKPYVFPIPEPDPSVNVVVPYNSYWAATFAPDSTDTRAASAHRADPARRTRPLSVRSRRGSEHAAALTYRNARGRRRRSVLARLQGDRRALGHRARLL